MNLEIKQNLKILGISKSEQLDKFSIQFWYEKAFREIKLSKNSKENVKENLIKLNNAKEYLEKIEISEIKKIFIKDDSNKEEVQTNQFIFNKNNNKEFDEYYFNAKGIEFLDINDSKALEYFNKAISLNKREPNIFYNRGVSKINLSDYLGAIKDLNKAITLNSEDENYFLQRGVAYYNLEKMNNANSDFTKAISLNSMNIDSLYYRGIVNYEIGESCRNSYNNFFFSYTSDFKYRKIDESLKDLKRAIELVPISEKSSYSELFSFYEAVLENKNRYKNFWLQSIILFIIAIFIPFGWLGLLIFYLFLEQRSKKNFESKLKNLPNVSKIINDRN